MFRDLIFKVIQYERKSSKQSNMKNEAYNYNAAIKLVTTQMCSTKCYRDRKIQEKGEELQLL